MTQIASVTYKLSQTSNIFSEHIFFLFFLTTSGIRVTFEFYVFLPHVFIVKCPK